MWLKMHLWSVSLIMETYKYLGYSDVCIVHINIHTFKKGRERMRENKRKDTEISHNAQKCSSITLSWVHLFKTGLYALILLMFAWTAANQVLLFSHHILWWMIVLIPWNWFIFLLSFLWILKNSKEGEMEWGKFSSYPVSPLFKLNITWWT